MDNKIPGITVNPIVGEVSEDVVLSGGYGSETWVNLTRGFHKFRGEYIEYSGDAYVRLYWRNWG